MVVNVVPALGIDPDPAKKRVTSAIADPDNAF